MSELAKKDDLSSSSQRSASPQRGMTFFAKPDTNARYEAAMKTLANAECFSQDFEDLQRAHREAMGAHRSKSHQP